MIPNLRLQLLNGPALTRTLKVVVSFAEWMVKGNKLFSNKLTSFAKGEIETFSQKPI
jgi:hypothetical protein